MGTPSHQGVPRLQYVVRGIKRAPRPPSRPWLPLTPSLLQAIKTCWAARAVEPDMVMVLAACCMGFFGFMRAGKFTVKSTQEVDQETCLSVQDVAVDSHTNPFMVRVHLKQSKTDPFSHGVDIFLGRTDAALCPVAAIIANCAIRPAIVRPFLVFRDGSPLTRNRLVAAVQSALSHAWEYSAYERYIRTPRESLAAISRCLSRESRAVI